MRRCGDLVVEIGMDARACCCHYEGGKMMEMAKASIRDDLRAGNWLRHWTSIRVPFASSGLHIRLPALTLLSSIVLLLLEEIKGRREDEKKATRRERNKYLDILSTICKYRQQKVKIPPRSPTTPIPFVAIMLFLKNLLLIPFYESICFSAQMLSSSASILPANKTPPPTPPKKHPRLPEKRRRKRNSTLQNP